MWPITARRLYKGKMNCLIKKVSSPNARTVSVVAGIEDSGISKGDQRRTQMLRISKFPPKIYVSRCFRARHRGLVHLGYLEYDLKI